MFFQYNICGTVLTNNSNIKSSANYAPLTSIGVYITELPSSSAIAFPFDLGKSAITTLAPCFTNLRTAPSPRPEAPPVTRATTP